MLAIIAGVSLVSCSIQPELFGDAEPSAELKARWQAVPDEWYAYPADTSSHPDYFESRETTVSDDPARGIGLKQAASMAAAEAPVPQGTRFRVFLFMGQSNMVGHGKAGKLPYPYDQPHSRIRIWSKGQWHYLVPRRSFGPEVAFAHEMAEVFPDEVIGIIKVAVSGTGMNAWKPDWEWTAASKTGDALKGSLYRDMIDAMTEARAISEFRLSGFVWKQGGRDGRKSELSETYGERFSDLVYHIRTDLGAPELPVFVLTYFDEVGLEEHRKLLDKVRPNALPLYLSKARVATYIDNAYPVFHGRLPTKIDQVHFDTEGQLMLGKMTAQAVKRYYDEWEVVAPSQ